jgi:hypothetical protein
MLNKFEQRLADCTFALFGLDLGTNILRVIYRIYYGSKHYPYIYWLKLLNIRYRIELAILKILIYIFKEKTK